MDKLFFVSATIVYSIDRLAENVLILSIIRILCMRNAKQLLLAIFWDLDYSGYFSRL